MKRLNLVYFDDKNISIEFKEDDKANKFIKDLNSGLVYYDGENGNGFWTDVKNIRYLTIQNVDIMPKYEMESHEGAPCGTQAMEEKPQEAHENTSEASYDIA